MRKTIFFVVTLFAIYNSYAQELSPVKKSHKIGFNYGYASQFGFKVNYDYKVHLFQLQYYYPLYIHRDLAIEIVTQPQYNLTLFKQTPNSILYNKGHEIGLNVGVLTRKYISKDSFSLYFLLSSGPHYVSGDLARQADGFMFSNNFLGGLSIKFRNNIYLDLRTGIRHMSNASLKQPNKGINNSVTDIGFYIPIN